jgi:hypothetical protein
MRMTRHLDRNMVASAEAIVAKRNGALQAATVSASDPAVAGHASDSNGMAGTEVVEERQMKRRRTEPDCSSQSSAKEAPTWFVDA